MKNKVHSRKLAVTVEWAWRVYMTALFSTLAAMVMWTLTLFSAWLLAPSTIQKSTCTATYIGNYDDAVKVAATVDGIVASHDCPTLTVPGPKIYEVSASLPAFLLATGMAAVMGLIAYAVYSRPQTEQKSAQEARREEWEAGKVKDEAVEATEPSETEPGVRVQAFSMGSFSNADIRGHSE